MSKYNFSYNERGNLVVTPKEKPTGALYGDYLIIDGEYTAEELENAKTALLNEMFDMIRNVAATNEEFFIINKIPDENKTYVAFKIFFPHLNVGEA